MAQWLASLASNNRQSPVCEFDPHNDNAEDLSQYDSGCLTGHKSPALTLVLCDVGHLMYSVPIFLLSSFITVFPVVGNALVFLLKGCGLESWTLTLVVIGNTFSTMVCRLGYRILTN